MEEELVLFRSVMMMVLIIDYGLQTIHRVDHEQTSSDLSRIVFLTWCDKHNIVQFSYIRFPSGCVGDGICSLLLCEFIKRISARAYISYMLIKSSVHHSINIQKESKIELNDEKNERLLCAVNLVSIDWAIKVCALLINEQYCCPSLSISRDVRAICYYSSHLQSRYIRTPLLRKLSHVPSSFLSS